jgi:pyrroloquinoline quinone (PQQ) biosynthesis protein C
MLSTFDRLTQVWQSQMLIESARPWMQKLNRGEMELCHYKGFLLETYHNTGYNPQLQAYATMFFKDNPRDVVKKFFLHASSEIAHDLLAMDDLMALGVPEKWIRQSRPLPTTSSFMAFTLANIQFKNPLCYLSYLFHLEMSPTTNGQKIIDLLKQLGVPENAVTFLDEHSKVDVGHMKMMATYIETLIKSEEDFNLVAETLKDCIILHTRMIESAFENGEKNFKDGNLISNAS